MERRLTELKGKIKTSTLAVFPVHVGGKSDPKAAAVLAEMLTKGSFGRAEAVTTDPGFQVEGNTNELKILWDTARALHDFLRKNPPATDYVLLADYGVSRSPDDKSEKISGPRRSLRSLRSSWRLGVAQPGEFASRRLPAESTRNQSTTAIASWWKG